MLFLLKVPVNILLAVRVHIGEGEQRMAIQTQT